MRLELTTGTTKAEGASFLVGSGGMLKTLEIHLKFESLQKHEVFF